MKHHNIRTSADSMLEMVNTERAHVLIVLKNKLLADSDFKLDANKFGESVSE
jgi:hypothetical protein